MNKLHVQNYLGEKIHYFMCYTLQFNAISKHKILEGKQQTNKQTKPTIDLSVIPSLQSFFCHFLKVQFFLLLLVMVLNPTSSSTLLLHSRGGAAIQTRANWLHPSLQLFNKKRGRR